MQKNVYAIGSEGVAALVELGHAPQQLAGKRLRFHELKELGIRHELLVSNIHTKLIIQTRATSVQLHWRQNQSVWDSAMVRDRDGRATPIPVRPDAYFVLEQADRPEGKNKLHFFLEADRSTMSHDRIEQKIKGYLAYHEQQRFAKAYPTMKSFHVVTVTETRARAESLRAGLRHLIATAPLARAYQFIALDELTVAALLPKGEASNELGLTLPGRRV